MATSLRATLLDYRNLCKAKRLDAKTIRWYDQKLRAVLDRLEDEGISTNEQLEQVGVAAFHRAIADLADQPNRYGKPLAGVTVRGYVQVIKGWLTYLEDEELIGSRIRRRIEKPQADTRLIKTLKPEHYELLLSAAKHEMAQWMMYRDRAMLRLLWDTGLRVSELCGLRTEDVLIEFDPHVHVWWGTKRKKEREVGPLSPEGCRELSRYLRSMPRKPEEVFFLNRYHQAMTQSGVDQLLYRLRRWADLQGVEVRAHVFRHTYAMRMLAERMDIKRLSLLLGHSSVQVTELYLRDFQAKEARKVTTTPSRKQ